MPKIDPVTGCTVMTVGEFWAKEAESEGQGRSGGDLMTDFFAEIGQEEDNRKVEIEKDAYQILNDTIEEDNKHLDEEDRITFNVTEVIEVDHIDVHFGVRQQKESFCAHVKCSDGLERKIAWISWHDGGSFYCPPEGATYVQVITDEQYESGTFTPDY